MFKHYIFDLDGTLMDTEEAILETWKITLNEYLPNVNYTLDDLKITLGITSQESLRLLNANVDDNFEINWESNYKRIVKSLNFFENVEDMLNNLKNKGYQLGIVSSRSRREYHDYFKPLGFDNLFSIIICRDDTLNHKPHPEPLLKYLNIIKAPKDECIYIGDMPTDIKCAKSAGISSALVTWGSSRKFNIEADYIFSSPIEITNLK